MRERRPLPTHKFDDPLIASGPPGFAIASFGDLAPWSYASFPHRHEFYELVCVTRGSGTHVIDFVPYEVAPVTLYFVAPGQVQFWERRSPLEGFIIVFLEEFLAAQYGDRVSPRRFLALDPLEVGHALRLEPDQVDPTLGLFASMDREYRRAAGADVSVLQAYLHILLVEMRRAHKEAGVGTVEDRRTALARRFLRLVSDEIMQEQTVGGYAARIGITPKYLADVVKRSTGRTPAEIIRAALTVEAKRLLAHTDLSIAQISKRLSFDNPSYFGRFFKREVGTSPGQFRRQAAATAGGAVLASAQAMSAMPPMSTVSVNGAGVTSVP
ncbi:helix-turn-helix domain-containing protein [Actinomadura spongiicola]|uniref:Helix-turn-helix domain-containing protein n=1 Tax=Actinomadura spongiicola TaxID=2303421 RepID=A0A372GCW3_9ACTN|nr:helix-turn-helix domain-containing protein [Actinomadura spongiicola]RFS83012.1 helix-turn-helix domain-containing protein [Actinomadura spongiicola]